MIRRTTTRPPTGSVAAAVRAAGPCPAATAVLRPAVVHHLIDHCFSQYGPASTDAVNGGFLAVVVLLQTLLSRTRQLE
ncbi:hypothetical protein [Streptomyces sp. NRRL F-5123]|uniref:hypothetical protein n=1 Tax=Streptomyces sp. NRRL F-5123 TaxID=1463856 RepID=UPI0005BB30F5|nr:hypothetical protein [Streptomyces sp. NRRL F-5123]